MPSDKAMEPGVWFVENTDPDTVGAITLITHPELKALFGIPRSIEHGVSLVKSPDFSCTYSSIHTPIHVQSS
jgi:hypothetical protein